MSGTLATAPIGARPLWNWTGVRLAAGQTYTFNATGRWVDWFVDCDANGYSKAWLSPFEHLRRAPRENWFKLIGSIDARNDIVFPIGAAATVIAPASGELTCFANDIPWMYWNNRGTVELRIG